MDILKVVGGLIQAMSIVPTGNVIIARENDLESDFNANIIVVDFLTNTPIGRVRKYDSTAETMTYTVYNKPQLTIDFYGQSASTNSIKFIALLDSQTAYEYKRDNQIEVMHNKTNTNIKQVQGVTNYDRFQVEIVVKYTDEFTESILRIDTVQLQVNTSEGKKVTVNVT